MASAPSLRLFLAIDLPPALRANIDQWRQRRHLPGRAELAPNMHITLVFLGQVAVDRIDSICDVAASTPFTAFDLTLDRIRLWRNGILHLAPSRAPAPLMELQQALNDGLGALGLWTERRRYSPHLTIARDVPEGRHGLPRCPKFQWHVDKLTLFSSERTDEGVLFYQPLAEWPVQAAPPQNTTPPSIPPSIDS